MYTQDLHPRKLDLEHLHLDPNNPRFTDLKTMVPDNRVPEEKIQQNTLDKIYREGVEDLVNSILRNGFLPLDRIVVRELAGAPGEYVAVEGNRRLAALKTIVERRKTAQIDYEEFPEEVQENLVESIATVNCLEYVGGEAGDIAWILQGIRHISGIRDWTPAQRAELVSKEIDDHGRKAREVGEMLGISAQAVNRLYRANKALRAMFADEDFGSRAKNDYFTLFQEAHQKRNVKAWLGWSDSAGTFTDEDNLRTFYDWISEDPDNQGKRRIHDPRQIATLNTVVGAQREDLLDKISSYEISVDEAKGRLDESQSQGNWKDHLARARESLKKVPLTALSDQDENLKGELEELHRILETLVKAASSVNVSTSTVDEAAG